MKLPQLLRFLATSSLLLIIIFLFPSTIFAQENLTTQQPNNLTTQRILFINQVRGGECCDPGSLQHLQNQLTAFEQNDLPANFALRYDALTDPQYIHVINNYSTTQQPNNFSVNLGIFLEITPSLAQASGVKYTIANSSESPDTLNLEPESSQWYQAQNAYTIGYSLEDRKKIVDTLFTEFKKQFAEYPTFTVGWIVDTPTLNYICQKYETCVHEITREQFGTDSYTLDGGPVHYPYIASKNWSFIPSDLTTQQPNNTTTLILRQTVSDPLFNYGDSTNAFTSQPNDYAIDGKNFDYFKKLVNQMLDQPSNPYSVAILGLENSMPEQYQQEYVKQIEYVAQLQSTNNSRPSFEGKTLSQISRSVADGVKVATISDFNNEFRNNWQNNQITTVHGKDLVNNSQTETVWINTPHYRVRLLKNKDEVKITDLRLYDKNWTDPYTDYQAQNLGYWIVPFLINSSRFYKNTSIEKLPLKTKFKDWFKGQILPEYKYRPPEVLGNKNDLETHPTGISLPLFRKQDAPPSGEAGEVQLTRQLNESVQLTYQNQNAQQYTISFFSDHFEIQGEQIGRLLNLEAKHESLPFIHSLHHTEVGSYQHNTLVWENNDDDKNNFLSLDILCQNENSCTFTPQVDDGQLLADVQVNYYPYIFPEIIDRSINNDNTILYAHNQYAIAGRNPIRFVLIPKDDHGYATGQTIEPEVTVEPEVTDVIIGEQQGNGVIFIDLVDNRVGKYKVKVKIGDQIEKSQTVYFAPNCKGEKWQCLSHPNKGVWYLLSSFYAKLRTI